MLAVRLVRSEAARKAGARQIIGPGYMHKNGDPEPGSCIHTTEISWALRGLTHDWAVAISRVGSAEQAIRPGGMTLQGAQNAIAYCRISAANYH